LIFDLRTVFTAEEEILVAALKGLAQEA